MDLSLVAPLTFLAFRTWGCLQSSLQPWPGQSFALQGPEKNDKQGTQTKTDLAEGKWTKLGIPKGFLFDPHPRIRSYQYASKEDNDRLYTTLLS